MGVDEVESTFSEGERKSIRQQIDNKKREIFLVGPDTKLLKDNGIEFD